MKIDRAVDMITPVAGGAGGGHKGKSVGHVCLSQVWKRYLSCRGFFPLCWPCLLLEGKKGEFVSL